MNTTIGLQLTQGDSSFLNTPLYHTGGWHVLFTPLMHLGGRVVLQKQFDAASCNDLITRERITILFGIPTTLRMMMEAPNFAGADFPSLRFAICGGEPCPAPVIRVYEEKGRAGAAGIRPDRGGAELLFAPCGGCDPERGFGGLSELSR